MFEAIHGSAPRMIKEKREQYADPTSMIKASILLLEHIGYNEKAKKVENALGECAKEGVKVEKNGKITNDLYTQKIIDYIKK